MSMSLSICLSQCHLKTMEKLSDKTMSSIYVVVVVVVHSRIRHWPYTTSPSSEIIIIIIFQCSRRTSLSLSPSWAHINRHSKHSIDTPNFFPMHMFKIAHCTSQEWMPLNYGADTFRMSTNPIW